MVDQQRIYVPTRTSWRVEIYHGVVVTDAGAQGGWGWMCESHDQPVGMHGFHADYVALGDLMAHMRTCGHSG